MIASSKELPAVCISTGCRQEILLIEEVAALEVSLVLIMAQHFVTSDILLS